MCGWAQALLYRAPSLKVTLATFAAILFAVPIDFAAGNLLSIYSPTKVEVYGFGRQRASLTTVLASFGIRGVLFGGAGLMLLLSRLYGNIWIVLPPTLSCLAYVLALEVHRWDCLAPKGTYNFPAQPIGEARNCCAEDPLS